ncbi:hypothetical protein OH77DRAFT_1524639 [Trametes cingulata]|nr:hypothetical protein OH77DRAFT_1524639 [Trametes cingulata]
MSAGEDYIPTISELPRTFTPDEVNKLRASEHQLEGSLATTRGALLKSRSQVEETERYLRRLKRQRLYENVFLPFVRIASILALPQDPILGGLLAAYDAMLVTPGVGIMRQLLGDTPDLPTLASRLELYKTLMAALQGSCDAVQNAREALAQAREEFLRRLHDPATRHREVLVVQIWCTSKLADKLFAFRPLRPASESPAEGSGEEEKAPAITKLASHLRDVADTFDGAIEVTGPISSLTIEEWEALDEILTGLRSSPGTLSRTRFSTRLRSVFPSAFVNNPYAYRS